MSLTELTAIGPLDGRYRNKLEGLSELASEQALQRYRVQVEIEWLLHLAASEAISEIPIPSDADCTALRARYEAFSSDDAQRIRDFEAETNHDVKAVEYFVKGAVDDLPSLAPHREFVHFACTSEDINNTAYGLMLLALRRELSTAMTTLIERITALANDYASDAMLSRTHGQAASPTTMGKELANVASRLGRQHRQFLAIEVLGKFNGAVGNYNAHTVAYPEANWRELSASFLQRLGLEQNPYTTQIEPHDYVAEYLHCLSRFNQVLLDFDRDIWSYISIGYFGQKQVAGETGSSTMPHKVNPIDFENSEGNLGIANALMGHLADKLPVSRWQRDLSDSTVLRNLGVVAGHSLLAYQATLKGIGKLTLNRTALAADLGRSWEVLAEPVQMVMRRLAMPEPYETLKRLTRGEQLDEKRYSELLDQLELPAEADAVLRELRPETYTGLAEELARGLEPGNLT
ncbi:MAG: adenylosuccinate lyase [Pseudomonadaceae bacterium]|nr:adenylosuccinate lyase [Pseudomonadaceae bacterium]